MFLNDVIGGGVGEKGVQVTEQAGNVSGSNDDGKARLGSVGNA